MKTLKNIFKKDKKKDTNLKELNEELLKKNEELLKINYTTLNK